MVAGRAPHPDTSPGTAYPGQRPARQAGPAWRPSAQTAGHAQNASGSWSRRASGARAPEALR